MPTDFERYGFGAPRPVDNAVWIATIDFEAFTAADAEAWETAMRRWAERSHERGWRFAFFVCLEDVAAVRRDSSAAYERLLAGVRELHATGSRFYPHNHWAVDLIAGGARRTGRGEPAVPGYRKRPSMFYDVVYRHSIPIGQWLGEVVGAFERFSSDAQIPMPRPLAFRAGGWDHGSSREEVGEYVAGLAAAGIDADSSASSGQYGTRDWRVGAPFGRNVFELAPGLVEVAPCWSLNHVPAVGSPRTMLAAARLARQARLWRRRRRGAFVTVQHFDHLFHDPARRHDGYFAVADPAAVRSRVDAVFRGLAAVSAVLRLPSGLFGDLRPGMIPAGAPEDDAG